MSTEVAILFIITSFNILFLTYQHHLNKEKMKKLHTLLSEIVLKLPLE